MKILEANKDNLKIVAEFLRLGKAVAYPTETAYGLAADPFNSEAIKKIYQIKGRDFKKRLPMIAESLKTVERFFILHKKERVLARKFWPGPLTIILNSKIKIQKSKLQLKIQNFKKNKKIAVRVSSNKIAQVLAKSLGGLVISTSANVSGKSECYSANAVARQFKNRKFQPDLILNAGVLKKIKPSTIVAVEKGRIKVIRQGEIKIE